VPNPIDSSLIWDRLNVHYKSVYVLQINIFYCKSLCLLLIFIFIANPLFISQKTKFKELAVPTVEELFGKMVITAEE